jgi:2,4-dienoyl-CoA reductase-like NADH-dependent reductase (Old Yellow Enzyme family)
MKSEYYLTQTMKKLNIFTPVIISGVELKNKLGLAPINTGLSDEYGGTGTTCLSFYKQYYHSGIGIIYIGGVAISRSGRSNRKSLVLDYSEKCLGFKGITSLAHQNGVRVVIQLMHAGRQANPKEIESEIFAPSALPCPVIRIVPRELSLEQIRQIIESFGQAAVFAERGGADFIEIHAAHGYLISEFLSPYSNHRQDDYGGSLQNRFRILKEILHKIRINSSIPIGVRINCKENVLNGLGMDDVINGLIEVRDSISYVSVTAGVYSYEEDLIVPSRDLPKALWKADALEIRKKLSLPVFIAGNIDSIALADQIVTEGSADVILMARALLADPNLVNKFLNGAEEDIQKCTGCMMCKYHSVGKDSIFCPYNSMLKKVSELPKIG